MPSFIKSKFSSEGLEKSIFDDLIRNLPIDLPLQDLLRVKSDEFWSRKLLSDYKVNYDVFSSQNTVCNPISVYFTLFLQRLFEGQNIPHIFTNVPNAVDA